jgi:hypothetical protein
MTNGYEALEAIMNSVVAVAVNDLTDDELITLKLVGALDADPRDTMCWPKAKPLFGPDFTMHDETKRAVTAALQRRGLM